MLGGESWNATASDSFTQNVHNTIHDYEDKFRSVDQDILSGVMAAVGLLLAFYGEALFNIVIFGVGFVLSSQGSYYILKETQDKTDLKNDAVMYISLGIGVVGGALLVWLKKVAIILIGAVGGALLFNFLYGLTAYSTHTHEDWIQYVVLGVGAVAGGVTMHYLVKQLLRAVTAFVGGFFVASSVGYYIDRFEHDNTAATGPGGETSQWLDIAEYFGRPDEVLRYCSDACIACLVTWGVIFALGCWHQYRKLPGCKKFHKRKKSSRDRGGSSVPLLVRDASTGQERVVLVQNR